jgi:DNA-binding NarL/FixJ family response regulator
MTLRILIVDDHPVVRGGLTGILSPEHGFDTDCDVLPAIEAGATGYLLKDAPGP